MGMCVTSRHSGHRYLQTRQTVWYGLTEQACPSESSQHWVSDVHASSQERVAPRHGRDMLRLRAARTNRPTLWYCQAAEVVETNVTLRAMPRGRCDG